MAEQSQSGNHVLSLGGNESYVEIANNEGLDDIGSQLTIEAWIKPTVFSNVFMPLVSKGNKQQGDYRNTSWKHRSYYLTLSRDGLIELYIVTENQEIQQLQSPEAVVQLGVWHHVAAVVDLEHGTMALLVNGVDVATRTCAKDTALRASVLPLRLGWSHDDFPNLGSFAGQMDEVRVWDVARSREQIQGTMYDSLTDGEVGLVGYWDFEGIGERVTDASGYAHHGICMGNIKRVSQALPTPEQHYQKYLESLKLKLSVKRQKPEKHKDVLVITPYCEGMPGTWEAPSIPVTVDIRDAEFRPIETLATHTGSSVRWSVPTEVEGELTALAKPSNGSEALEQPQFTCQAHSVSTVQHEKGHWQNLSASDRVPGRYVWSVLQDRNGLMWFGILGRGLCRYDGHTFRAFTVEDGLPSNDVWCVFEDSKGLLWMGTMDSATRGAGICSYDGHEFTAFTTDDGLVHNGVMAVYEDSAGNLWFGTAGGVSMFDGQRFHNYTKEDGLGAEAVGDIIQDRKGNLWFTHGLKIYVGHTLAMPGGVTRYDGESFTVFSTEDGLAHNTVNSVAMDRQGYLWFATNHGVSRYNGEEFSTFTASDGLANNWAISVSVTEQGDIMFGTDDGVSRFRNGIFDFLGAGGCRILDIASDQEGNLWCVGQGCSIKRYDNSIVNTRGVTYWYTDRDGNGWGGPGVYDETQRASITRYDGQTVETFAVEDGMWKCGAITGFLQDGTGKLWFGAYGAGLGSYDGEQFEFLTVNDGLWSNGIILYHQDHAGRLWLGSQSHGAGSYAEGKFALVFGREEFGVQPSEAVFPHAVVDDTKGNLWVGSAYGLIQSNGTTWTRYTKEDGLPSDDISSLLVDSEDNLWMSAGNGLCRYDGKEFHTYTTEDGLVDNDVSGLFEDSRGRLWFRASDWGVQCFDGRNFQHLTVDDGLLDNSVTKILEDDKERMVFGTQEGFTTYTPTQDQIPPSVFVDEVVADTVYAAPRELSVSSAIPRISFSYHGLSFRTQRIRYNTMLEGYDDGWQSTWDREVSYENLKPGSYTFRVIAINRDLVYSTPACVELEIAPDLRDQQIAELESALEVRNRELESLNAELGLLNAELHAELQDARTMQMSLMPEHAPDIQGAEIAGKCVTSNTVGGDFFSYLLGKSPHSVGLVVADISGKAMRGAMNAVLADGILSMAVQAQDSPTPASIMSEVNTALSLRMESDMNVTMVIGLLDTTAMTLTLANAAHHAYPLLVRNGQVTELKSRGLPLGMRAGIQYREETFDLQSGDILVLMTDGIIEAHDSDGNMYGNAGRLEQVLRGFTAYMTAEEMVDMLIQDTIDYSGGERDDDMTVVISRVLQGDWDV